MSKTEIEFAAENAQKLNDLISRSALLEQECFMDDDNGFRCSVVLSTDVRRAPAVDAEKVCEQMGLVKEALEMAKADLVPVVRCRDCVHYEFGFCVRSILYSKGPNGYCENGERRSDS